VIRQQLRTSWHAVRSREELVLAAGAFAVVAIAALLRVTRIWWGMPYPVRWDEPYFINAGLRIVGTGEWKPEPMTYVYGTLPIYVSAAASGLAFIMDAGRGLVRTPAEYAAASPFTTYSDAFALTTAAPSAYVASRLVSVTYGVATVAMVYLGGRRLGLRFASLFGAALVAVCQLHIYNTSMAVTDGPATLFMTISLLGALAIANGETALGPYLTCGVSCGLAIGSKSNLAVTAVLLPLAHVMAGRAGNAPHHFLVALASIPIAFLLVEPYAILDYSNFLFGLGFNAYHYGYAGHAGAEIAPGLTSALRYLREVPEMLGALGSALALVGVVVLLRRRPRSALLLLGFAVTYILVMSRLKVYFPRNALPLLPIAGLLASAGLSGLAGMVPAWGPSPLLRAGVAALGALAVGPSLLAEATTSRVMLADVDTRERSVQWLRSHAAEGSHVAVDHDLPFHFPSLEWAGFLSIRLETDQKGCAVGPIAVEYVVTTQARDCAQQLQLVAEFPGKPVAQEPLFSPQVYVYQLAGERLWARLAPAMVDAANQPFFDDAFVATHGFRQFSMNGAASFGPLQTGVGRVETRIMAAGTVGGGRSATVAVDLVSSDGVTRVARQSIALSSKRTEHSVTFEVAAPGTYLLQLAFEDDFYAPGQGDRNVELYSVRARPARATAP
jgi:hypothetical protein